MLFKLNKHFPCSLLATVFLLSAGIAWGGEKEAEADPEFGGQILTLTEPKAKVEEAKSNSARYKDKGDGSVLDLQETLVWAKQDSYQSKKQWMNWHTAQKYIKKLNEEKFAGADNWRLPTKAELGTLYDENSSIAWNYYWTKNEVHLDPIFGNSHCCYWSAEEYKKDMAWGFNFIRGKPYISMKGESSILSP